MREQSANAGSVQGLKGLSVNRPHARGVKPETLHDPTHPPGQNLNGTFQAPAIAPGLLRVLDDVYASLRARHPDLPLALVTVEEPHPAVLYRIACWRPGPFVTASGVFAGRIAFGYPAAHRDVPRLLFTGPPASVLEVLVHEAAHALGTAREIRNTSRGGTYYNERYRDLATELGLSVTRDQRGGWTNTTPTPALLARHEHHLAELAAAIPGVQSLNGTAQARISGDAR